MPNYKNAFRCKKCPQSNKEDGCPAWNEMIMTNATTGDQRVESGCFFQVMPALVVDSIKASTVATNTHAGIKNEMANGFAVLAQAVPQLVDLLANTEPDDAIQIESGDKD